VTAKPGSLHRIRLVLKAIRATMFPERPTPG
jgi:hypothetical protein